MPGNYTRAVNAITIYRIIAAPLLLVLVIGGHIVWFKWLLIVSFLTDAVDGIIARKFKAVSVLGARLDSIGDDLTFVVAVIGLAVTQPDFIKDEWLVISLLLLLFLLQLVFALVKYGKMTSFHAYSAKLAAILQACFLITSFLLEIICYPLFYMAAVITAINILEEIILVMVLPKWKADVKGLYWVRHRLT